MRRFSCEHDLVIQARRLLAHLEPEDTPDMQHVHVGRLSEGVYGECSAMGHLTLDPHSPMMRSAQAGNLLPLAMLLHHEGFHARHGADEAPAYAASLKFCADHHASPALVAEVVATRDHALATIPSTPTATKEVATMNAHAQAIRQRASTASARSIIVNRAAADARRRMHELRSTAGRRNSQADQDNLDSALAALIEAGARHKTNPTAQDAGASVEHQTLLDQAYGALVQAGASYDDADDPITSGAKPSDSAAGADNLSDTSGGKTREPIRTRYAQAPDPYASVSAVRDALTPFADPNYQIRGHAPDGHAIGLAMRAAIAADDVEPSARALPRDSSGTPNPYSPEAIARHQRAREARTV